MSKDIDFENKDFWRSTIQKSAAKRLIKRKHTYPNLVKGVCNIDLNEVENLIELDKTFIKEYDLEKREEYLYYYCSHKYEDWQCKRIIDLDEIDIYDICEGKGQSCKLDFENIVESKLIENGEDISKNLALIKMTDLGYSENDIEKILEIPKLNLFILILSLLVKKWLTKWRIILKILESSQKEIRFC